MTIEKAQQNNKQSNMESWCQKVLDLLDLVAESLGLSMNYHIYLDFLITWDGNSDKHSFFSFKQGRLIVDFMEYSRYFQKPKPSYQSQGNSHKG